ncbi:aldolase [Herbaspirillum rubrisubalbicans]|uniref:Aldolase n=1 Tax=Herbaspirillum rubrisubalbicans TaxID=80842 RepID=A0ABX9C7A9_9BURK|nr:CoA ester lyase [Herbaspirillum rubrisubalbicans]RAM66756.1 aldolase [Herbaspirillum rubrisubalbicans]RAN47415.1 aldolase [Herbaspirillum rubrisubalbicans]
MDTTAGIARSYLFVPGNRPERYAKACAAGADAVIVDLEDAVPPEEKASAREALAAWLDDAPQAVLVRINAVQTPWFHDDLTLCAKAGVAGIVLPKAESADDIATVVNAGARAVLPLVESARGFWHAHTLAQAVGVERLVFGTIDFCLDLGLIESSEQLQYFRSQFVLVSRLAGIAAPVDGVTTSLDDPALVEADTLRARRGGFGGKLCIHPRQVGHVNRCFAPTPDELSWAGRVLAAAAASAGAAVAVDGKMVDLPVLAIARRIVAEAQRRLD